MKSGLFAIAVATAALLLACVGLAAQTLDEARQRLDFVRAEITRIESALTRGGVDEAMLQRSRGEIEAAADAARAIESALAPRQAAARTRLDQLVAPKDDAKSAPEGETARQQREAEQKQFDELDAALKRARLLIVQADQTRSAIAERRRDLFAGSLLERSPALVSPALWRSLAVDLPRDARALATLSGDWFDLVVRRAAAWQIGALLAYLVVVALLIAPLRRRAFEALERRREGGAPSLLHRTTFALWSALVFAALPLAAVVGGIGLLDLFGLAAERFTPVLQAIGDAVARTSIVAGLSYGLLAPRRREWRVFEVSDAVAQALSGLFLHLAIVVSAMKVALALFDASAAAPLTLAATRGVGALAAAAVVARGLLAATRRGEGVEAERAIALAAIGWIVVALILVCVFAGYMKAAAFVADQLLWISGVVAVAVALSRVVTPASEALLAPDGAIGRALARGFGLSAEALARMAVIVSGLASLLVLLLAALLLAAPFGVQSADMFGALRAVFFGVEVGGVTLSLSAIVAAAALFAVLFFLVRAMRRWLETRLLPSTGLDQALRNAIGASFGYVGFAVAATVAFAWLGFGLDKVAIVAGALSVGIGFGLQSIVSNFVSGLILLWERAIRVGDWIEVGAEQGHVRRINIRSTEIETFDRALVSMPNANLISGVVKNWVRGDRMGRIKIAIGVSYAADPRQVREALIGAAKSHEAVLGLPAPLVLFTDFGDSALMFELICFVEDVETQGRVKSDLRFAIFDAFREAGIEIPFPQRDMNLRGAEGLVEALDRIARPGAGTLSAPPSDAPSASGNR